MFKAKTDLTVQYLFRETIEKLRLSLGDLDDACAEQEQFIQENGIPDIDYKIAFSDADYIRDCYSRFQRAVSRVMSLNQHKK